MKNTHWIWRKREYLGMPSTDQPYHFIADWDQSKATADTFPVYDLGEINYDKALAKAMHLGFRIRP